MRAVATSAGTGEPFVEFSDSVSCWINGAGDRDRTGDIQLGKLAFYR